MGYLVLGALLVGALYWFAGRGRLLKRPEWRIGAAVFAVAVFAAAAYMMLRRQWAGAAIMFTMGLWLATSARFPRVTQGKAPPSPREPMSLDEAYQILDLKPGATREEIDAAYKRLMKVVHPDHGGGEGLAAKLNAARARLRKG